MVKNEDEDNASRVTVAFTSFAAAKMKCMRMSAARSLLRPQVQKLYVKMVEEEEVEEEEKKQSMRF